MATVFPNGNYRSFVTIHADTNEQTLYTAGTGVVAAFLVNVHVSDDGASARTYSLTFTDSSESETAQLWYTRAIAASEQANVDFFIAMEAGDTIKGTASAAGVHSIVTVCEIAGRRA